MRNIAFIKNFDEWNETKKKIELNQTIDRFPKEGEVWMSHLGVNIGFEQSGAGDNFSRPVLIIRKINNNMFLIVPLSTKQKNFDFYFNFKDPGNLNVSIVLAQIKLFSVKRLYRKMYSLPSNTFKVVKNKIRNLI